MCVERFLTVTSSPSHSYTHKYAHMPTNNKRLERNLSNANHVPLSDLFHCLCLSLHPSVRSSLCLRCFIPVQLSRKFHAWDWNVPQAHLNYVIVIHVCGASRCISECHRKWKRIHIFKYNPQEKEVIRLVGVLLFFSALAICLVWICG